MKNPAKQVLNCCVECGLKARERANMPAMQPGVSTFHMNECDACGEHKAVTSARAYGWPFERIAERFKHWT